MTPKELLKDPTLLRDIPDYDLELSIRGVVEHIAERGKRKNKGIKLAQKTLFFVGEVYKRNPDFSCAIILHYAEQGCNVNTLIRQATQNKDDPRLQGFLDYLRATLNPGASSTDAYYRGRLMVRRTTERASMWAGDDAETTRRRVRDIRVAP